LVESDITIIGLRSSGQRAGVGAVVDIDVTVTGVGIEVIDTGIQIYALLSVERRLSGHQRATRAVDGATGGEHHALAGQIHATDLKIAGVVGEIQRLVLHDTGESKRTVAASESQRPTFAGGIANGDIASQSGYAQPPQRTLVGHV